MRLARISSAVLLVGLTLTSATACTRSMSEGPAVAPERGPSQTSPDEPTVSSDEASARRPADASSVAKDEIEPNETVETVLAGRVAGVRVQRTGSGIIVHIRGRSTIMGNVHPLYVLDGLPIEPGADGSVPVNLYDIASIRVLKDPVDTAMYGVRGANGVIVIATKTP